MTASLRGLIALTALAVVLAIAVVIDRPARGVARSARLLPGFDPDTITRVELGDTVVVRDGEWRIEGAFAGPADAAAMSDVLGALELASAERWMTSTASSGLDGGRRVRASTPAQTFELVIGAPTLSEQVWASAGGRVALIARWVAEALDRDAASLRRRAVVTTARPTGVELHAGGYDLVTSGDPVVAHLGIGTVRLAPAKARALADALAALRLVEFPADPAPAPVGTLRVLGAVAPTELDDLGPCGSLERIAGTAGGGCVSGWDAVLAAARAILDDATAAVDPAPLAEAPVERIVIASHGFAGARSAGSAARSVIGDAVVERRGGGWTLAIAGADQPPDDDAIDTLIDALRAPARVVPLAGDPAPKATLTVTHTGGASEQLAVIDSVAGPALRRDAEPFALVVGADVLTAVHASLVDRSLIAEEWSRLTRVLIEEGGTSTDITRGASLDDWTPATAAKFVTALRELLIDLRAESLGGDPVDAPARTILLHYDAPPVTDGEPADHELRLSRDCRVTVDGATTAHLAPADCRLLLSQIK